MKTPTKTDDEDTNRKPESTTNKADPYVYVDGKKEMADGSGMVKESFEQEEEG